MKKTTKKATTKKSATVRNVAVEIYLPDGCPSLYVGRLVSRTDKTITIVDAAWISQTGRRHEFFSGKFDANAEFEPYPDGVTLELPADGTIVIDWPHELIRSAK